MNVFDIFLTIILAIKWSVEAENWLQVQFHWNTVQDVV